uniref:Uncharacterized protein n=1 Tax=Arundo donax TaxID=35708 RepID=A0A0A9HB42_ARUDO
MPGVKSPVRK